MLLFAVFMVIGGTAKATDNLRPGTIIEVVSIGNDMGIATIKDENGKTFLSQAVPIGMASVGQKVEIHTPLATVNVGISAGEGGGEPPQFVIFCALGGPAVFAVCLTIFLVLL